MQVDVPSENVDTLLLQLRSGGMWRSYANAQEGAHPHGSPPVEHPNQVGDDSPPHLFRVEGAPLPSVRAESAPHGEGLPFPESPAGRECNPPRNPGVR